jgi:Holliday junction DNA helicase RuvB
MNDSKEIENNIFSLNPVIEDLPREVHLRPKHLDDYIGQSKIIKNIKLMIESANIRNQAMEHVLFSGPPGLGKTSLSMLIANSLGSELHIVSGPAVEKKGDLAAVLTNLKPRSVLFIDEIHRLNIAVEEILYSAMEDFRLDILIGQGPSARTMQIDIPPFTLIGATTRSGLLSSPLRDRFSAPLHFDFYNKNDLEIIVSNNSKKLGVIIEKEAAALIAGCSRGTPRIANRILKRVRDFLIVRKQKKITLDIVQEALNLMEIDYYGLDRMDRKILSIIHDRYNCGPVGIETLCATLSEDKMTIEDVYEPYLLMEGFLIRTPRGRALTDRAVSHVRDSSYFANNGC